MMMLTERGRRWAVVTAVAGTVFIAAGAFWLSFTALADLAVRSGIGAGQAWAWPLIVDGIIVVATVAAVALAGQRVAWYPWALLIGGAAVSVTANALHAVVAADADVPGLLAAAVAAVPPVVLLAITHLTVILTRTGSQNPALARSEIEERALAPWKQSPSEAPAGEAPGRQTPARSAAALPPLATPGERPVRLAPEPSASHATGTTGEETGESDRRVLADRLRVAGHTNAAIARQLGVHPSTVGRWFATAHLNTTTPETKESHP